MLMFSKVYLVQFSFTNPALLILCTKFGSEASLTRNEALESTPKIALSRVSPAFDQVHLPSLWPGKNTDQSKPGCFQVVNLQPAIGWLTK